jgi:hypothetical protein
MRSDLASAGKPHLGNGSPSFFVNLRELDTFFREGSHLGFEDVAHEKEFVGTILIGREECGLSRRHCEDSDSRGPRPRTWSRERHGKCTIRFGVFTVDNYLCP